MITEKEFILTIKSYPELYKNCRNQNNGEESENRELWSKFARENHFKSGTAAECKWRKLVSNYVSFLVYGTPFAYQREMQFMQMPLMSGGNDDTQSDSDIDEMELKRILDTYDDDCPTGNKRKRIDLRDERENSPQQHTASQLQSNDYNDENTRDHSAPANAADIQYVELLDDTNSLQSMQSDKPEDIPPNTGMPAAAEPPTPTISSNLSNAEQSISGSFTNLTSLELIFLGYAKVLQRMPLRLQLQTKRKISDIMDEAELQMLEEK